MDAAKEHRLIQTIFVVVTELHVIVTGDALAAFQFAKTLAQETIEAIRSLDSVDTVYDVHPEAVGRYVAQRCHRFLDGETRAAIIAEAIGEGFGVVAQNQANLVLDELGLTEGLPGVAAKKQSTASTKTPLSKITVTKPKKQK